MRAVTVIGIGCDDHGDQVAGLLVARIVAARAGDAIAVRESCGAPAELIAAWRDAADVTVVEAMPGVRPGAIDRCQPHPRPLAFGCSPTRLSPELREALALGPLPARLTVVTIEAQRFARAAGVSPEVAEAARLVADTLLADASVVALDGDAVPAGAAPTDAPAVAGV